MKIRYTKQQLPLNLLFGIAWAIIAALLLFVNNKMSLVNYGFIIVSTLYLAFYVYEYKNQYLTVKGTILYKNSWFGTKLDLTQITCIKKLLEDYYLLKTEEQELTINTSIIDKKSLIELNRIVELNLSSEKKYLLKTILLENNSSIKKKITNI